MERFILSCKLIGVAVLVIIAILSLTVSDAFGFASATAGFGLPDVKRPQPPDVGRGYTHEETMQLEDLICLRGYADDEGDNPGSEQCIPEPMTIILLGAGFTALLLLRNHG